MDVVVAVLRDLYRFTFVYRFGLRQDAPLLERTVNPVSVAPTTPTASPEADKPHTNTEAATPLLAPPESVPLLERHDDLQLGMVGYVYVSEAYLYVLPTRTFDGVLKRLPYGTSLEILSRQGNWFHVIVGELRGWLMVDAITEVAADLYPTFQVAVLYDAAHAVTTKVRTLIQDAFHTVQLDLPLQDSEYVTYKLSRKSRTIPWGTERPRLSGSWQKLLKGLPGVHIGVHPKTGSVMESIRPNNTGHVSYVDSVFPDGSIAVSGVGEFDEGMYYEKTLAKEEWVEFRPVFIEIT